MLCQCLAIHEKTEPDMWTTFNTRPQLGASLVGQGKFAEAEPLNPLHLGRPQVPRNRILPRAKRSIREAAKRVVKLYQA
jgi:eukaryotic-like serine/threonine-protein kinase